MPLWLPGTNGKILSLIGFFFQLATQAEQMPSSLCQVCSCFEALLAYLFLITNQIENKHFSW